MDTRELIHRFPRINEVREVVAEYSFAVSEVPQTLKIKVEKFGDHSYMGVANLKVKGVGSFDFYRSLTLRDTIDAAVTEALTGFFAFLDEGAEVREVEHW